MRLGPRIHGCSPRRGVAVEQRDRGRVARWQFGRRPAPRCEAPRHLLGRADSKGVVPVTLATGAVTGREPLQPRRQPAKKREHHAPVLRTARQPQLGLGAQGHRIRHTPVGRGQALRQHTPPRSRPSRPLNDLVPHRVRPHPCASGARLQQRRQAVLRDQRLGARRSSTSFVNVVRRGERQQLLHPGEHGVEGWHRDVVPR